MNQRDMTVLLLVKGRDIHTLRWMWHANRVGFKYPVIIADGGNNPVSRRVLADHSLFPNLDYQYVRYNDASYLDYYKKVVDAAERATTPFVFRADNDDFILPSGVERALDYLRAHPDYVWAGANLGSFSVAPKAAPAPHLVGQLYRMVLELRREGFEGDVALERIRGFLTDYNLQVYYAVFRREHFKRLYDGKVALNLQNLELCDLYKTLQSLLLGKHHVDTGSIVYLHQTDTSEIHQTQPDLAYKLMRNNFIAEYNRVLDYLGDSVTPEDRAALDNAVRTSTEDSLRHQLRHGKNMHQRRMPAFLRQSSLMQRLRLGADLRIVARTLSGRGADAAHLSALQSDLAEVQRTLESGEFLKFLALVAPETQA